MRSIAGIIYLVIGMLVAATKDYLGTIDGFGDIINLLLAILLWPLVLLGVKFNLRLGGGGDKDGEAIADASLLLGPPLVYARGALGSFGSKLGVTPRGGRSAPGPCRDRSPLATGLRAP